MGEIVLFYICTILCLTLLYNILYIAMNAPENYWKLVDLPTKASDKLNFYWNFYVATNMILIGWVISSGQLSSLWLRLGIVILYCLFIYMSLMALGFIYKSINAILTDLKTFSQQIVKEEENNQIVISDKVFFKKLQKTKSVKYWYLIHLVSDILIILFLLFYDGTPSSNNIP